MVDGHESIIFDPEESEPTPGGAASVRVGVSPSGGMGV